MKILRSNVQWKDSFQELLDIWQEKGLCEVGQSPDRFCWVESDKRILLHEHDRVTDLPEYDYAFFANEFYNGSNCFPWIYWPRYPRKVEAFKDKNTYKTYSQRNIESIFIGAAENPIQYVNRTRYDWSTCVEEFDFTVKLFDTNLHRYSNEEYLSKIQHSKFGLSIEGYGKKCQRDIEYMALGVVPIFTWKSFNDYAFPLKENVHYLYANNPREAKIKIQNCTEEQWKIMSDNCRLWYHRYCSPYFAFQVTKDLIYEKVFSSNS